MANACPRRAFRWTRTASLLLAGLLAATPALAESPVESFNTQYRLKAAGFPFTVGAQRTLSKAGGEREARRPDGEDVCEAPPLQPHRIRSGDRARCRHHRPTQH